MTHCHMQNVLKIFHGPLFQPFHPPPYVIVDNSPGMPMLWGWVIKQILPLHGSLLKHVAVGWWYSGSQLMGQHQSSETPVKNIFKSVRSV